LLALLDTDPATGRPPIFSLPLARLPVIPDGGLSAVFTFGARPPLLTEAIDGSVPVVFVANAQQGGVRIDVADTTRLRMTSPLAVQIDLPAGATIGETRLDAAGFAWLDMSFLSLISRVTEGASGLSTVMGFSEGSADFFIDFGDVPVSVAGASVGRLSASVMLDKAPNYAPFLSLTDRVDTVLSGQAGIAFNIGKPGFFGGDHSESAANSGFDMRDPVSNLAMSTVGGARFQSLTSWLSEVPRPIVVARPSRGELEFSDGSALVFPNQLSGVPSLDSLSKAAAPPELRDAEFVAFAGEVFRALTLEELAGLHYRLSGEEVLGDTAAAVRFMARDSVGGLSGELLVRSTVVPAVLSGDVQHWGSKAPVPGVSVLVKPLEGSPDVSASALATVKRTAWSGENGDWSATGLDFARYGVEFHRVADPFDIAASVDASDLLASLKLAQRRFSSGNGSLAAAHASPDPALRSLAADLDRSGTVDLADSARVLRLALGDFTDPVEWRFYGADGPVPASVDAGKDTRISAFGVLPGDLDWSWHGGLFNPLDPGSGT